MDKDPSAFRRFLLSKWEEHCAEVEAWEKRLPDYPAREYWIKYRWWLKKQFQQLVD